MHVLLAAHQTRVQLEGELRRVAACVNMILYKAKLQSSERRFSADFLIVRHCAAQHMDILYLGMTCILPSSPTAAAAL